MGPAWLVAGPGLRDSLAVAGPEAPVVVPPVVLPVVELPVAVPPVVVAGQAVGASILLVVPVTAVAVAVAPTNPVVVFPTRPEMVVRQPAINKPVKKKRVLAHLHCLLLRLLLIWVERRELRLYRVLRLQSVVLAL